MFDFHIKLDAFVIERADKLFTFYQRHGGLLTSLRVHLAATVLLCLLWSNWLNGDWVNFALNLFFWGSITLIDSQKAKQYGDYPIVVRSCQALNTRALWYREAVIGIFIRLAVIVFCIISLSIDLIGYLIDSPTSMPVILNQIGVLMIGTYHYALCAFALGNGNFGSKKKTEVSDGIRQNS